MTQQELESFVEALPCVEREDNMGYIFYFVGDYHMVPFMTIGVKDNEHDNVSQLDREGIFRLNLGVSKQTFDALFPAYDPQAAIDYAQLDVFLPHPHYASHFFISILNPSAEKDEEVRRYIIESHSIAQEKQQLRQKAKDQAA